MGHRLGRLLRLTGFFLYRVGNTGIPGVWLFHTGNRYSFDNIVPASVGGLLATPPPGGHGVSVVILFQQFIYSKEAFFVCLFLSKHEETCVSHMVSASRTPPRPSTQSLRNIQTTLLTPRTRRKKTTTPLPVGTLNSTHHLLEVTHQRVLMLPPPLQRILISRCRTTAKTYR